MPGVPSYRGCDACHKQKKKCDQASPACARCTRLKIPCVGKGQLRYKFKTQTAQIITAESFALKETLKSQSKGNNDTQQLVRQSRPPVWTPPHTPSNEVTLLCDSFASLLSVTDPKYDLTCFGDWFANVPMRLGSSQVLDSAASAFVEGLIGLRVRGGEQTVAARVKYGKALKSLRDTLQNPDTAKSPYTLCAIFLIMVSQSWYSKELEYQISHMEGIVHLLNASAGEEWKDEFEAAMRLNMVYPASVEAVINPTIKLDPWYLSQHTPIYGPYLPLEEEHGQPIESLDFAAIMNFPRFVREPERHIDEMKVAYRRLQIECPFSLKRVHMMAELVEMANPPRPDQLRAQVQLETAYSLALCYALILNAFLLAFDPLNIGLYLESLDFAREAINISRSTAPHLPIGAGFMPAALFAAWVATDDVEIIKGIKVTLAQYDAYMTETKYVVMFRNLKRQIRDLKEASLAKIAASELTPDESVLWDTSFDGMNFDWGLGTH